MRKPVVLLMGFVCFAAPMTVGARDLTFDERVAAQKAIEQVYWEHRVWPNENPGPKPALSTVMSDESIRAKVEDYLRKSNALEKTWRRPITAEQLQAELDRMANGSQDGSTLRELYHALGDDPSLIAETLARQTLADRLIRNWYSSDTRFHGGQKAKAEAARAACASASCLRAMSGDYLETTLKRRVDSVPTKPEGDRSTLSLTPQDWSEQLRRLAPVGVVSAVDETPEAFMVTAVLAQRDDEIATATVSWPKRPFDTWWNAERGSVGSTIVVPPGTLMLGNAPSTVCTADSWSRTHFEAPDGRSEHLAIWTGTEMIVWGGTGNGRPRTGGRYNPATDTWTPVSTGPNAPDAGFYSSIVWTGTEMIVWGGFGDSVVNTGARYNPSTDTWTRMSTGANVPSPRFVAATVWTGSEMIVWGGVNGVTFLTTGGRYNPSTDTWVPTSTGANVPAGRYVASSVWTGTEMIVWGGETQSEELLNSGGRYNPSTDSWTPTSTGAGVPGGRYWHTAVWTGTQMIVWGGEGAGDVFVNSGGRYNPATNTWVPTSMANVPAARVFDPAVWTGTEMIVWGGSALSGASLNTGGRYNPATNTWTPTSAGANVPSGRAYPTAVWTGTEMLVWGGSPALNTGGRYNPSTNTWVPTSNGAVLPRGEQSAIWTGSEMIVWGGSNGLALNSGGTYRPATDSWTATSTGANVPSARAEHGAVWTGSEMLVWGGASGATDFNTGRRYNPATDTWSAMSTGVNVPSPRHDHSTVWTGTEMLVWGGTDSSLNDFNTGGRYNPSSDGWAATSTGSSVPAPRGAHTALWTGNEMIVWGGHDSANTVFDGGGRYTPATDSWTTVSTGANAPTARHTHTALWTGTDMIVWGGTDGSDLNTGGRYDPSSDTWTPTSTGANVPEARHDQSAVWTGEEMIVWGGIDATSNLNSGGRYNPASDGWSVTSIGDGVPPARYAHGAVWTGTEMVIWGGLPVTEHGGRYCACPNGLSVFYRDVDGDGHGNAAVTQSACALRTGYAAVGDDCNDADASVFPGASELNDGVDNQCTGQPGYGIVDEIADTLHVNAGGMISWTDGSGAATFDVARSPNRNLSPCDIVGTATSGSPSVTDATVPPSGTALYYVVRAASAHIGSWGKSSAGVERVLSCP